MRERPFPGVVPESRSPERMLPTGGTGGPEGPKPSGVPWAEPPAYRAHPLAPPGSCVNCGTAVPAVRAVPRCWECGRPLCAECYWRHALSPAEHRCAGCAARAPPLATGISGGRISAVVTTSDAPSGPEGVDRPKA
jgi:hypothetical protein